MTRTTSAADSADPDLPDQHRTPSSVRFGQLPERIMPEDMVATQETEAPPEPTMGRDTERDFILRNAGF